ncbi:MAG: P-loop NTPase [Proteobacteria bacterium]|nr:P-loop NTPase [Pseudomonadota bacterium]
MAREKTIWSVGGGKGGIGKSVTTANIGCALAMAGKKVVLVDADLGGANLHTYFGIKFPERGLEDFIKGRTDSLMDTSLPTPVEGLRLITGGGEFLGIANPQYARKQRLIKSIKSLDADYILVDLGAGTSYNVLDFFAVSNEGIVVLVPEPASIQNTYLFLKSFVYRRLMRTFSANKPVTDLITESTDPRGPGSVKTFSDLCEKIAKQDRRAAEQALFEIKRYRPKLLLNMASSKKDERVVEAFQGAANTFLGIDPEFIGTIYTREAIKAAARKMRPFMLDPAAKVSHADVQKVVEVLMKRPSPVSGAAALFAEPSSIEAAREAARAEVAELDRADGSASSGSPGPSSPSPVEEERDFFGFNDNVEHMETVFHVQTEVVGGAAPQIETVVYHGGRIFFSKRQPYNEVSNAWPGTSALREFATRQHRAAIAAIKMNKITLQGIAK